MRNALKCAVASCALAASATATAAPGDTIIINGEAEVSVVEPIGVQPVADLRFGRIIQPDSAGTLTVAVSGALTETGGVTGNAISTPQTTNGRGPGAFAVFGDANRFFIVFSPGTTTVNNGTASMNVDLFRGNVGAFGLSRFDGNGYAPLIIGARLSMDANQQVGSYSGTYDVTVLYL